MKLVITILDYSYAAALKIVSCFSKKPHINNKPGRPNIILIPGVYESHYHFKKVSDTLSSGFNIIHTSSIYNKSRGVNYDADAINTYINDKKLSNVIMIGHSSGGLTATRCLMRSKNISRVITIATPFHGVANGRLLRTKLVRELLPSSEVIKCFSNLDSQILMKITSLYPRYDNQIWNDKAPILNGARNVRVAANGHHLILRSKSLQNAILSEIKF